MAETILQQLPADEFPYFTEMIIEHALAPGYAYAKEFRFGLDLILDGLERIRDEARLKKRKPRKAKKARSSGR